MERSLLFLKRNSNICSSIQSPIHGRLKQSTFLIYWAFFLLGMLSVQSGFAQASLTVSKEVDQATINTPTTLNYTITVQNNGTVDLTNVSVVDVFAGGAVYSSGDTDSDGELDLTESWIYAADYVVTQTDIDAGTPLVNTASVTSTEVTTPVEDFETTWIDQTPELTTGKTADDIDGTPMPTTYNAIGDEINYTITVENTGNVTIDNIVVTDANADPLSIIYVSGDTGGDGT